MKAILLVPSKVPAQLVGWDYHIHTTIYKIDKQKGFTVQHGELYPISCNNL